MNPNQMMNPMAMLQNLNSNPLFQQAQRMAQGKSEAEIIQIARNICRERESILMKHILSSNLNIIRKECKNYGFN